MHKNTIKHVFKNIPTVSEFCGQFITNLAINAILERGVFTVGVSGGSIINMLASQLAENPSVEWKKWKIFFCDERLTPFSDGDSTYGQYKEQIVDKVGFADSWVPINPDLPVEECAKDYEKKLRSTFSTDWPEFDLLLLGMGPDGHTCSLFPDHKLLKEKKLWIAPISDSPKPPPCRVTMTLPVLNHARCVAFISTGVSKADVLKNIFSTTSKESSKLPAALVNPTNGTLHWILDDSAASLL